MEGKDMDGARKNKLNLSVDYRFIIVLLLVAIAAMLVIWKPWSKPADTGRTISVTGEATLKEEPDEYAFYPSYPFKGTDKTAVLAELTAKSEEVTAQLKKLGVAINKIKTDSSGYNYGYYYDADEKTTNYTLQMTIRATDKELAQKVQDYLITTSPEGQISPQAGFSETMKKGLEDKGREEASRAAREKAERSAKNLGFKVGKVKSVEDNNSGGGYDGCGGGLCMGANLSTSADAKSSLAIQPGQNEFNYSVTVVYFVD
jgi:uncharacterized protein YggE